MEPRVLLLAGEGPARTRLQGLLEKLHCQVTLADTPEQALARLREAPAAALVIVDLPSEEAQRFRRAQQADLALSGISLLAIGEPGEVDAEGHVPRPIDAFVLHDRMRRLILLADVPAEVWRTLADEGEEDLASFLKQSLRTMVGGLPGLVATARARNPDSPTVEALLGQAVSDGARVEAYASYLDSFARGGGAPRPLDVRDTLESVLRDGAPFLRQRAAVHKHFSTVPLVMAKKELLLQIFSTLVINAAQAIPPGAPEAHRIDVWTYAYANGWAMVEVSDTGSGIPADLLTKIFEPYFSTKRGLGLGLGLFVARNLVTALGGRIGVESELGRGSTFKVSLPPATPVST